MLYRQKKTCNLIHADIKELTLSRHVVVVDMLYSGIYITEAIYRCNEQKELEDNLNFGLPMRLSVHSRY